MNRHNIVDRPNKSRTLHIAILLNLQFKAKFNITAFLSALSLSKPQVFFQKRMAQVYEHSLKFSFPVPFENPSKCLQNVLSAPHGQRPHQG